MKEYTPTDTEKAIVALYRIVGMNQVTPDIVATAGFMLKNLEQERQGEYVRYLQEEAKTAYSMGKQRIINDVESIIAEFGDQGLEVVAGILQESFHGKREVHY